jgi:uncharacterized protein YegJ (DUF2314 family)
MREPNWTADGWELESGEIRHAEAPDSFWIPPREDRERLRLGDIVQLLFRIELDDEDESEIVERMWVVVRGRVGNLYFGILDNQPASIAENEELWIGAELPFRAEHVIDIHDATKESIDLARNGPRRAWPRD